MNTIHSEMNEKYDNQLSILVVSCDKYSDLWDTFFVLLEKYWPDCPYKIYFGSNFKKCEHSRAIPILIGEDKSWTENVSAMLQSVPTKYVLIFLEDYYLSATPDTEKFRALLAYAVEHRIHCLRLKDGRLAYKTVDKRLGLRRIEPGAPYFFSASPAIWEKAVLERYLIPGYSAWDFELKNSKNIRDRNLNFLNLNYQFFQIKNGVVKGKYLKSSVQFLNSIGIEPDTSKRGILDDMDVPASRHMKAGIWRTFETIYAQCRFHKLPPIRKFYEKPLKFRRRKKEK